MTCGRLAEPTQRSEPRDCVGLLSRHQWRGVAGRERWATRRSVTNKQKNQAQV